MHFDLFDPILDIVEGVAVFDGVSQDNTHSSSVVCLCDCFESLLTGCIPDLQFKFRAAHVYIFGFEVDAWVR
jgi:hypothetical protein